MEIETLKAQAEVEPLIALAEPAARAEAAAAPGALRAYVRNVRLGLFGKAQQRHRGGEAMMNFLIAAVVTFVGLLRRRARCCSGLAADVRRLRHRRGAAAARSTCCSARWSAVIDEPGLHFLLVQARARRRSSSTGSARCYVLDMRLDQEYLRSQPVNSEEGAPMGIGIWYEMFISDPGRLPVQERRSARLAARQRRATPPCAASAT